MYYILLLKKGENKSANKLRCQHIRIIPRTNNYMDHFGNSRVFLCLYYFIMDFF